MAMAATEQKHERASPISVKRLYELYWDELKSPSQIALVTGIPRSTIERALRTYNIPTRDRCAARRSRKKPQLPISAERLYQLYWKEGHSPRQIGLITGHAPCTVRRWLRSYNIPTRNMSAAARNAYEHGRQRPSGRKPTREFIDTGLKALEEWRRNHPDAWTIRQRKANSVRHQDHRARNVPCYWCGALLRRVPSDLEKTVHSYCNHSHGSKGSWWIRYHRDEPRPLIVTALRDRAGDERNPDRLRRMAEEIGAGDAEVAEVLFGE